MKKKRKMDSKISGKRIWIFRIILVAVSLLLVVFVEMALWMAGYGHNFDLFEESKAYPGHYVMNEFASEKFFMTDQATVGYYEPFQIKKAKDSYRIFVLGESTTVGYPYTFNGSFHRWLKYRLMFAFPDTNFEIINLSLTAVNSYTIADFAGEIVKYEPDAVLIYVGHNEYYGALGVGSTLKIGSNPKIVRAILALRQLKLYQLMNNIVEGFKKAGQEKKISERNLIQNMPADRQIAFESERYHQGIRQFSYNMNRTCEILDKANVPVLISNLVSNEKDLKPFISDSDPENSASGFFDKARDSYQNENFDEAKTLFVKAKDYDMLRFRAPEAINAEIEKLAASYEHVKLVDTKSRFEKESPHGILGQETLLEHVHPNLFGYALMSDAYFEKMRDLEMVSTDWSEAMSFEKLLNEMPVNEVDSLRGVYQVRFMLNEWPFSNDPLPQKEVNQPKNEFEKSVLRLTVGETTWDKVQSDLFAAEIKKGNTKSAQKISEAFSLIGSSEVNMLNQTALLCVQNKNLEKAAFYFTKAFRLVPSLPGAQQLGKLYVDIDDPGKALVYYRYIKANDNTNKINDLIITILEENVAKKNELAENGENLEALNKLAWNYAQMRSTELARKYLQRAQRIDPKNAKTIEIGQVILQIEEETAELLRQQSKR